MLIVFEHVQEYAEGTEHAQEKNIFINYDN